MTGAQFLGFPFFPSTNRQTCLQGKALDAPFLEHSTAPWTSITDMINRIRACAGSWKTAHFARIRWQLAIHLTRAQKIGTITTADWTKLAECAVFQASTFLHSFNYFIILEYGHHHILLFVSFRVKRKWWHVRSNGNCSIFDATGLCRPSPKQ